MISIESSIIRFGDELPQWSVTGYVIDTTIVQYYNAWGYAVLRGDSPQRDRSKGESSNRSMENSAS